jgi:hypothetical protein
MRRDTIYDRLGRFYTRTYYDKLPPGVDLTIWRVNQHVLEATLTLGKDKVKITYPLYWSEERQRWMTSPLSRTD